VAVEVYEGIMAGMRCRGRPRLRWVGDMEEGLGSVSVKKWRKRALSRKEWAAIVKEAKAKL
jgi:hypothetical protein